MTRLQDERQTVIAFSHSLGQAPLPNSIHDIIEQQDDSDDCEGGSQIPYPCGDTRITAVGIEPFVLDGLQLIGSSQRYIGTVDTIGISVSLSVWYFRMSHFSDIVFQRMIPSFLSMTSWRALFMSS